MHWSSASPESMYRSLTLLPFAALVCAPLSAQAPAPVLHPPLIPPGNAAPLEAGGVQRAPHLAAGDGAALAVWVDHRAEFTTPLANQGAPDVFAIRVGPSGAAIDPVALRLPDQVGDANRPLAAWNGSSWLVVWENQDPDAFSTFTRHVLGARVAADGTLLDSQPIVVKADSETTGSTVAVGSDGVDWVVVAQGTPGSSAAVVAIRVAADGTVADPVGTVVASPSTAIYEPRLAFASDMWLLTYASGPVYGRLLDQDLTPTGPTQVIGTGSNAHARLATDGTNFLVAWQNSTLGASNIRARGVVAATGALTNTIQVTPVTNGDYNWDPHAAWSGTNWHVAFRDTTPIQNWVYRTARIAPDLTLLDPGGVALPIGNAPGEGEIPLAGIDGGIVAAYELEDLSQPWPGEVRSVAIDETPAPGSSHALSLSAPRQGFADLVAGPDQFLAVFVAEEPDGVHVLAQRFDPFGAALDSEPVELAVGDRLREPAAAWNGTGYLVVWDDAVVPFFQTDDETWGRRLGADGVPLDPSPFFVMRGRTPDVAANAGTFLVATTDAPSGDDDFSNCYVQRVGSDGALLGATVQAGGNFARYPSVAPLGDGWVVTWQRNFTHDNPNSVARACLVDSGGVPAPDLLVDGAAGFGGASRPQVASSGDSALIVWQDDVQGVGGRTIDQAGTLGPAAAVAPAPAAPAAPALAWNGEEYLVAWADYRGLVGLFDYRADVFAARVDAGGGVLDVGGGFPVSDGVETEFQPAVAGSQGTSLIGFTELLPEPPYATLRVQLRRESPWQDEAGGVGSQVAPLLQAQGDLVPSGGVTFFLTDASPSAPGLYVFGTAPLSLPLYGGVVVPVPDVLLPFTASSAGEHQLGLPVPPALAPGTAIYVQSWSFDPGAAGLVAGSNGISSQAP